MYDLAQGPPIHFVISLFGSGPTAATASDHTVQVAIVTAIGLVIAAAITAVASTFRRPPSPADPAASTQNFTRDYINTLVRDQKAYRKQSVDYSHLREGCLEHGLDPDVLIREQRRRDREVTP